MNINHQYITRCTAKQCLQYQQGTCARAANLIEGLPDMETRHIPLDDLSQECGLYEWVVDVEEME